MASLSSNSPRKNLRNAVVALLAPLTSIFFYISFLRHCAAAAEADSLSPLWNWCYQHPFLLANVFFFLNVNLLFWLVGLLQSGHWVFSDDRFVLDGDTCVAGYYSTHPLAEYNAWRSRLVIALTWVWSVRLSHSYFRREKWQWGAREDWRFRDMSRQYGKNWWWIYFFAIYVSQQVFLMGICLPLYIVHSRDRQLNFCDVVAALVCLTGVTIAYFADTQLHSFVSRNEQLKNLGAAIVPTLGEGLWLYCNIHTFLVSNYGGRDW